MELYVEERRRKRGGKSLLVGGFVEEVPANAPRSRRTSVEMIVKHYARHLKNNIDTADVNVVKSKNKSKSKAKKPVSR